MAKRGQPLTVFDKETRAFMAKSMLRGLLRREIGQKVGSAADQSQLPSANEVQALHSVMPERRADEPVDQWLERGVRALRTSGE